MGISATQKTRLGIFVILGMVILAAFIITPIWMKLSYNTVIYYCDFEGESLQGLEVGADVKFNGVHIGRVEKVDYIPEDITRMRVTMSIAESFPMRVDMNVGTGFVGITGLKFVEISGGSNEAEFLKPGGIIPTRRTMFATVGEKLEGFADQIETLFAHLNVITNPDSLHSIKIIIDNMADLTGDAKYMFRDVRKVMPGVHEIMDTVQTAMNEVAKVTRDVSEMTETIKSGVAEVDIPELLAHVDSTIASVKALTDNVTMTLMQTREDFSITMENLRDATESANQLMRSLAENPSLLIRGDLRERDRR